VSSTSKVALTLESCCTNAESLCQVWNLYHVSQVCPWYAIYVWAVCVCYVQSMRWVCSEFVLGMSRECASMCLVCEEYIKGRLESCCTNVTSVYQVCSFVGLYDTWTVCQRYEDCVTTVSVCVKYAAVMLAVCYWYVFGMTAVWYKYNYGMWDHELSCVVEDVIGWGTVLRYVAGM
jgi:hypothetical protein